MERFGREVPALFDKAAAWLNARFGLDLPHTWKDAVEQYGDKLKEYAASAGGPLLRGIVSAIGSIFGFLVHLFELLLIPVFAFYFLVDWPHIVDRVRKLVPPRYRPAASEIAREIDEKISHWVRGQLIVVAILAVLYAIALSIVGIHLAIVIGLLAGLLTFIPYAGTVIGLGLSVLMALLDWQGPGQLIAIGAVFVVLHLLESYVLVPKLVGAKVGLGEAGALFGVLAGAQLLGFVGVMLAIPLAASAMVVVRRLIRHYESTEFFTYGAPDEPPPPPPAPPPEAPPSPQEVVHES
jgi:predicted PurR-regulated permease PerM